MEEDGSEVGRMEVERGEPWWMEVGWGRDWL